jgi:hypothetical protein
VNRFWARREDQLARELRLHRPEASDAFVRALAARVDAERQPTRYHAASRFSFASALTVLMLGTLLSFGGFGFAASGVEAAFTSVKQTLHSSGPQVVRHSAAQDQYGPETVTICHDGQMITINKSELPAYLRDHPGDTVGACATTSAAPAPPAPAAAAPTPPAAPTSPPAAPSSPPAGPSTPSAGPSAPAGAAPSGVASAGATRSSGEVAGAAGARGTLAATATSHDLPFTGISLAATVLLSLALILVGLALRRRAAAQL